MIALVLAIFRKEVIAWDTCDTFFMSNKIVMNEYLFRCLGLKTINLNSSNKVLDFG